jgi:hypothetical protein
MVGGSGSLKSKWAWNQVYRAVDHGFAKNACMDGKVVTKFPKEIEDFANTFVTMQTKRHSADYDPSSRFAKSEVVQDMATVVEAIGKFRTATAKDRRAFCAHVLFKKRPSY